MKTFEQLTIDELIDYCMDLRESAQLYKELPGISVILNEKFDLITDEDEKEFYKTVIEDVILEIENNIHLSDYEIIKDKMVEESFHNFSLMDEKIKQQLKIDELLKSELDTISGHYCKSLKYFSPAESGKDYYLKSLMNNGPERRLLKEINAVLANSEVVSKMAITMPTWIDCNFRVDTIGQFQRLSYRQYQELNFPVDTINLFCRSLWGETQKYIFDLFRQKTNDLPEMVTCFKAVDNSISASSSMSYFKIDKKKELAAIKNERKNGWRIISANVRNFMDNKTPEASAEVVWFKISSVGNLTNFNYSDIYKNERINCRNITWFKLMDYEPVKHHSTIAYFRIDIDGSVTKEEVAYFNTNKEVLCKNSRFMSDQDEMQERPNTLHCFVTDNDINKNKDIPMLIGYSECDLSL